MPVWGACLILAGQAECLWAEGAGQSVLSLRYGGMEVKLLSAGWNDEPFVLSFKGAISDGMFMLRLSQNVCPCYPRCPALLNTGGWGLLLV